jgi:chemotaxis response regulator CheB
MEPSVHGVPNALSSGISTHELKSKMPTVIVIDDDFDIVEFVSEILMMHGINVLGKGYNGMEAVELYRKYRPEVVLLDMCMPVFDGFYAIEKIILFDHSAFIVAFTGLNSEKLQAITKEKKITILPKPFKVEEFVTICNFKHNFHCLEAKQMQRKGCLCMVDSL